MRQSLDTAIAWAEKEFQRQKSKLDTRLKRGELTQQEYKERLRRLEERRQQAIENIKKKFQLNKESAVPPEAYLFAGSAGLGLGALGSHMYLKKRSPRFYIMVGPAASSPVPPQHSIVLKRNVTRMNHWSNKLIKSLPTLLAAGSLGLAALGLYYYVKRRRLKE